MLFRSALLDVKPFRTGLVVTTVGLMVTLGGDHGGVVGNALGGGVAKLLGGTGSLLLGLTALLAGGLVVSATMDLLGVDRLEICPWALREGIILRRLDGMH